MGDHIQFETPEGHWTPGKEAFDDAWGFARDRLRFHKGAGFEIKVADGAFSAKRSLADTADRLRAVLEDNAEDTIVSVRSQKDQFILRFRRHQVSVDKGEQVLAEARSLMGTPYLFRVTDCSWLTKTCVEEVSGVSLPHNAHAQHLSPLVTTLRQSELKPGDLVFISNDDHVALWIGTDPKYPGGPVVIDTQPHSTNSPAGWPTSELGTGVRIRPAFGNYYDADQNGWGRVPQVNGQP